jgi:uncharacterized membrane protein YedE/YeeE
MKSNVGHHLSALVSGLVFGAGLVISGMTQPQKVLGFLDPFGRFDASLILVMMGAIAVHFVAYRIRSKRSGPLFSPKFLVPTRRDIDAKLLAGAFIFGAGWGLGGYCPGPGIVSLAGGGLSALAFVGAMVIGMLGTIQAEALLARRKVSVVNKGAESTAQAPAGSVQRGHTAKS